MIPIVYHPEYVAPLPDGHRFPMSKFAVLYELLREEGIATDEALLSPERASTDDLRLVHSEGYIRGFDNGTLSARATRKIGLPWSPKLVARTRRAVGGTILTARAALRHGLALNTAGGTHHAFPEFGSGFCIFNDLAVAAHRVLADRAARRVLIFDLDVHQGDGTAVACAHTDGVTCVSVHCEDNFPFRKQRSDIDVGLPAHTEDERYLEVARDTLTRAIDLARPELVLYDAGVDVFRGDRLGRLDLSLDGLWTRELEVLDILLRRGIPTACTIGGGYDRDIELLADRHALVHRAAARVAGARACDPS